jgi:hypothetical protein
MTDGSAIANIMVMSYVDDAALANLMLTDGSTVSNLKVIYGSVFANLTTIDGSDFVYLYLNCRFYCKMCSL